MSLTVSPMSSFLTKTLIWLSFLKLFDFVPSISFLRMDRFGASFFCLVRSSLNPCTCCALASERNQIFIEVWIQGEDTFHIFLHLLCPFSPYFSQYYSIGVTLFTFWVLLTVGEEVRTFPLDQWDANMAEVTGELDLSLRTQFLLLCCPEALRDPLSSPGD